MKLSYLVLAVAVLATVALAQEPVGPRQGRPGSSRPAEPNPENADNNGNDRPPSDASDSRRPSRPSDSDNRPPEDRPPSDTTENRRPNDNNQPLDSRRPDDNGRKESNGNGGSNDDSERRPTDKEPGNDRPTGDNKDSNKTERAPTKQTSRNGGPPLSVAVAKAETFNVVQIRGSIEVSTMEIRSVSGYGGKNALGQLGGRDQSDTQKQPGVNFITKDSKVVIYVSSTNKNDRDTSFANYELTNLDASQSHTFPLNFNITVELPPELRGRSDFTLYLFVYIRKDRMITFQPAGISNILLLGTNRLVQKLTLYVRPAGVLVQGAITAHYMSSDIQTNVAFRVIIMEESLNGRPIADLQINKPGTRYPVPFSILVSYQAMKPGMNYYAFAFILVNGVSRPISTKPVWVITQERELVQQQIIFVVVPDPFILNVRVVRSQAGSRGELQEGSYLAVRLIPTDSKEQNITYYVGKVPSLPFTADVKITSKIEFDPAKQYQVQAVIFSSNNRPYLQTTDPVLLPEQSYQIDLRVEDTVYFVQCYIQSPQINGLNFVPGSVAQIFVTDAPESPEQPIIFSTRVNITNVFTEFSFDLDVSRIQKRHNYYVMVFVNVGQIITHISKVLIISEGLAPPTQIQVPLIAVNQISGTIRDKDNRPAQWTSSSVVVLYLVDSTNANQADKNAVATPVVQTWEVHLNNDFPIRFNVPLDFSKLVLGHTYYMQALIKDVNGFTEYSWAGSDRVFSPQGFVNNVNLLVTNVKTNYTVHGLIYIENLPQVDANIDAVIVLRLTRTPDILRPTVIKEITIAVSGKKTPIPFAVTVPLNEVNVHNYYFFLVEYKVGDRVLFPSIQAWGFNFRTDADVVITISQSELVGINGQANSPNGLLVLPQGCSLHIYILESANTTRPSRGVISEVYLPSKPNQNYIFTLNLQLALIEQQRPLYLNAAITYGETVIMQMPQPSPLQLGVGGEWNINMVISLPTLIVGQITTLSTTSFDHGNVDVYFYIIPKGQTLTVLQTFHIQIGQLPAPFTIEADTTLLAKDNRPLEIFGVIKNCKEEVLYKSGGVAEITIGVNVNVIVPLVFVGTSGTGKPSDITPPFSANNTGNWVLSITGTKETLIR